MGVEDAAVQNFIIYKIGSSLAIVAVMWYFKSSIKYHAQQRLSAWIVNRMTWRLNHGLYKYKQQLFQSVHEHKENVKNDLEILEVGVGTAANLQFFPDNCKLTCLDPNAHFVGYIKHNLQECDTVVSTKIVHGYAEKMPFEDNAFDVVVVTMVLCCVTSVEESLAEIRRVLKPGGVFLFLEHVSAEKTTWTHHVQKIANPFHQFIGDGCNTTRETGKFIEKAGFGNLHIDSFHADSMPFWLKPFVMGIARK